MWHLRMMTRGRPSDDMATLLTRVDVDNSIGENFIKLIQLKVSP